MRANGTAIRALRQARQESQERFAARAQISRETLRSIEDGRTENARAVTVIAIAAALGVPVAAISDDPSTPSQAVPA